jgi:hypothetical protein
VASGVATFADAVRSIATTECNVSPPVNVSGKTVVVIDDGASHRFDDASGRRSRASPAGGERGQ